MAYTQEDIYKHLKIKLAPPEQEKGVLPLLRLLASKTALPPTGMQSAQPTAPTSDVVSNMIPDTGKQETNMQKNSLMAKYPGLGAK